MLNWIRFYFLSCAYKTVFKAILLVLRSNILCNSFSVVFHYYLLEDCLRSGVVVGVWLFRPFAGSPPGSFVPWLIRPSALTIRPRWIKVIQRWDETPHWPHRPHRQHFLPHQHQITAPAPKTTTLSMAAAADNWTLS